MEEEKFKLLRRFQYSSEAMIYAGKLESYDIEVFLRDQFTIDSNPFYSNALGGIRLFVKTEDYERAHEILNDVNLYSVDDENTEEDENNNPESNKMKIFITGIGTDVGKTIVSSIVTEALEADYWKPIQAGDLDHSDSHKVKSYVSNEKPVFHPNSYALNTPASPHLAELDGITIDLKQIKEPKTDNHLVIEGAGGIFVPLNDTDCVIDLIQKDHKVIVVSRHYLGSINHTLLTIEALQNRKIAIAGIIFSGDENKATEDIILKKTNVKFIGRIETEPYFDQNVIRYYADKFRENLLKL